jgi:hypothetical protein
VCARWPPTIAQGARAPFVCGGARGGRSAAVPGRVPCWGPPPPLGLPQRGGGESPPASHPRALSAVESRGGEAQRTPEAQSHATTTLPSTTADAWRLGGGEAPRRGEGLLGNRPRRPWRCLGAGGATGARRLAWRGEVARQAPYKHPSRARRGGLGPPFLSCGGFRFCGGVSGGGRGSLAPQPLGTCAPRLDPRARPRCDAGETPAALGTGPCFLVRVCPGNPRYSRGVNGGLVFGPFCAWLARRRHCGPFLAPAGAWGGGPLGVVRPGRPARLRLARGSLAPSVAWRHEGPRHIPATGLVVGDVGVWAQAGFAGCLGRGRFGAARAVGGVPGGGLAMGLRGRPSPEAAGAFLFVKGWPNRVPRAAGCGCGALRSSVLFMSSFLASGAPVRCGSWVLAARGLKSPPAGRPVELLLSGGSTCWRVRRCWASYACPGQSHFSTQRHVLIAVVGPAILGTAIAQAASETTNGDAVHVTRVPPPRGCVPPAPLLAILRKGRLGPHRSCVVALRAPMCVAGLVGVGSTASAVVSIDGGCARGVRVEADGPRLSLCGVALHSAMAWGTLCLATVAAFRFMSLTRDETGL